jgi:hypothetical protein
MFFEHFVVREESSEEEAAVRSEPPPADHMDAKNPNHSGSEPDDLVEEFLHDTPKKCENLKEKDKSDKEKKDKSGKQKKDKSDKEKKDKSGKKKKDKSGKEKKDKSGKEIKCNEKKKKDNEKKDMKETGHQNLADTCNKHGLEKMPEGDAEEKTKFAKNKDTGNQPQDGEAQKTESQKKVESEGNNGSGQGGPDGWPARKCFAGRARPPGHRGFEWDIKKKAFYQNVPSKFWKDGHERVFWKLYSGEVTQNQAVDLFLEKVQAL